MLWCHVLPVEAQDRAWESQDLAWQKLAEEIQHLDYGEFLYARPSHRRDAKTLTALKAIEKAMAPNLTLKQLERFATHPNSKVRTLAIMKAFLSEKPEAFRIIHKQLKDDGSAFPGIAHFSRSIELDQIGRTGQPKVETQERKVQDVARMMMDMVGYHGNDDFEVWTKERIDNPDWLGWYEFLLKPVTQGTSPIPAGIEEKLSEFEKRLNQRPPALRAWLSFIVAGEDMRDSTRETLLGTKAQVIEGGKFLEPDALLEFLRTGNRSMPGIPHADLSKRGSRFILRHARELFRLSDAEPLKEMGYFIAAADLRPDRASAWLREACQVWDGSHQSRDRARAMATLLALKGQEELEFVVNWFYQTASTSSGSSDHSIFISEYRERKPETWKTDITALIEDPGFDSLKSLDVIYLALMINHFEGKEVIEKRWLHEEHAAILRNELRRFTGIKEETIKWINFSKTSDLAPEWTIQLDSRHSFLDVSPDGKTLAIGAAEGEVEIRKATDGSLIGKIPKGDKLKSLSFLQDTGNLSVIRFRNTLEIWGTSPLAKIKEVNISGFQTMESCCLAPDGNWLASRHLSNIGISLYDPNTGEHRWTMKARLRAFAPIEASPDGSRFVVADGFGSTLMLFTPEKQTPLAYLRGHADSPRDAIFSTDGSTLVTTGNDSKILVWNAQTGKLKSKFVSRPRFVAVVGSGEDPTEFFFASQNGTVDLIDVKEGRLIKRLSHNPTRASKIIQHQQSLFATASMHGNSSELIKWQLPEK
jgi:WD40 repeat protein